MSVRLEKKFKKNFRKKLREYKNTFNEKVRYINVYSFYINFFNEIVEKKKERIYLNNGKLYRDDLINIIVNNSSYEKKTYDVFSLLKYNFNLCYDNILTYNENNKIDNTFLSKIKDVEEMKENDYIKWNDTLNVFKKYNLLYLFFKEIPNKENFALFNENVNVKDEEVIVKDEEVNVKDEEVNVKDEEDNLSKKTFKINIYRKMRNKRPNKYTKRFRKRNKLEKRKRRRKKTRKIKVYYD